MSEKEEKRGGQRPRKSKRKEKNNKAEGLSKKKREKGKHKVLMYAKGI